jgi:hypothetical protein
MVAGKLNTTRRYIALRSGEGARALPLASGHNHCKRNFTKGRWYESLATKVMAGVRVAAVRGGRSARLLSGARLLFI